MQFKLGGQQPGMTPPPPPRDDPHHLSGVFMGPDTGASPISGLLGPRECGCLPLVLSS